VFYEHLSDHLWINDDFYASFMCINELPWLVEDL